MTRQILNMKPGSSIPPLSDAMRTHAAETALGLRDLEVENDFTRLSEPGPPEPIDWNGWQRDWLEPLLLIGGAIVGTAIITWAVFLLVR
jgi:hypothetical protein